ncbi:MAG: pyridoxamine 5'-phosphate oxidase family protein [Chloroflexi bacterium]|nr:pyridoxamine 5'-phosphate oxidase family protein [Chloroflexota bacterium]
MSDLPNTPPVEEPAAGRPLMVSGYGIDQTPTEGMLPWAAVRDRIAQARNYWVATTQPNGAPHVMPVWGLWLREAFYFSTDPASRKGRNLAVNPRVAVHLESGDDVVILEGTAERLKNDAVPSEFSNAYFEKYQVRLDTNDPSMPYYRVNLRVALAWLEQDFLQTATRWRFGAR